MSLVPYFEVKPEAVHLHVDGQNDFGKEGAPMQVPGGWDTQEFCADMIDAFAQGENAEDNNAATADWHDEDHDTFGPTRGVPSFTEIDTPFGKQLCWNVHCVKNSEGARYMPKIEAAIERNNVPVLRKGTDRMVDSLSGVRDKNGTAPRFDHGPHTGKSLVELLREKGKTDVFLTGLCEEICVADNASDLVDEGFNVYIVLEGTRPLNAEAAVAKRAELEAKGVKYITAAELPQYAGKPQPEKKYEFNF
ncbi:MAG: isochorismatase family protein [Alphaproteobacteria bacterium]|nr:isochorismatase family protein [Alphaproteobacteria bacterium]